ncbi:MAG: hypothetical protein HOH13_08510, partial [Crocinitomicaceae bacterium]|nr:hypothetical protein [Crocinitomicaceae bacterium]
MVNPNNDWNLDPFKIYAAWKLYKWLRKLFKKPVGPEKKKKAVGPEKKKKPLLLEKIPEADKVKKKPVTTELIKKPILLEKVKKIPNVRFSPKSKNLLERLILSLEKLSKVWFKPRYQNLLEAPKTQTNQKIFGLGHNDAVKVNLGDQIFDKELTKLRQQMADSGVLLGKNTESIKRNTESIKRNTSFNGKSTGTTSNPNTGKSTGTTGGSGSKTTGRRDWGRTDHFNDNGEKTHTTWEYRGNKNTDTGGRVGTERPTERPASWREDGKVHVSPSAESSKYQLRQMGMFEGLFTGGFAILNLPKQIQDIKTALDEGHNITAGLESISTALEFMPYVPAQILAIITNLIARYTSPKDGSLVDEKKFRDELSILQNEMQLYIATNSFWGEKGFVSDVGQLGIDWAIQTGKAALGVVNGEFKDQLIEAYQGNLTFLPTKLEAATRAPTIYDKAFALRNKPEYGINQQLIGDNANVINQPGFWDTIRKIHNTVGDFGISLNPLGEAHASELMPLRPPLPEGHSYLNISKDSEHLTNETKIRQDLFHEMDDSLLSMHETVSNIKRQSAEDTPLPADAITTLQNGQSTDIHELHNNLLSNTERTFEHINISIEDTVENISSSLENTFANIGGSISNMFDSINLISSANADNTSNNYVGHGNAGSPIPADEKRKYDLLTQNDDDIFPRDFSQWTDDMDDHYTQAINNLGPTGLEQTRESNRNTQTLTKAIKEFNNNHLRTMLPDNLPTSANVPVKPNYEKRAETESEGRTRRFTADIARYLGDTSLANKLDSKPLQKDFEQPGIDNNNVNQNPISRGFQNQQLTMLQKVNMLSEEDRDTYEFGDRDYSGWTNKMQNTLINSMDDDEFGARDYSGWTNKMQDYSEWSKFQADPRNNDYSPNPWMELLPNHPKWDEPYKEAETEYYNDYNSRNSEYDNSPYQDIDKSETAARTYAEILRNLQIPQYIQSQLPNGMIKDYSTGGFISRGFSQSPNSSDEEGLGGAYEAFNKRAMEGWKQEAKNERMRSGRQRRIEDDRNAKIFTT